VLESMKNAQIATIHETNPIDFIESVSPGMQSLEGVMLEVAQSDAPVLLLAEPGTGKKATARRIHGLSRRSGHSFRVVSCRSLMSDISAPNALLDKGTVFLEELAELDKESQLWLAQILMSAASNHSQKPGLVRLICGSARDLESEVRTGRFREDLYYRLSGVCLRIPPLRQRREDIPHLVEHFLEKYGRDFQRPVPALSAETHRLFQEYSWPGNMRELENAAKAIVALGDESVAMGGLRAMLLRQGHAGNGGAISLKQASRAASREKEKEIILRALTRTRWNRRRAAQDLQISYKALLYKLKQMGCSEYEAS
jgi:two-component system, NtrC family, response regulator AtoC